MKFVFKKIKAVDTEEVTVLDKKSGSFFTSPNDATVEYVFRKPGEDSGGYEHPITLKIDDQFFVAKDLEDLISFLQAAKQRLEKLDAKTAAK